MNDLALKIPKIECKQPETEELARAILEAYIAIQQSSNKKNIERLIARCLRCISGERR